MTEKTDATGPLRDWCVLHADKVAACYVSPFTGMMVFVVTRSPKFDFDFATEVAAMELRLAKSGWAVGLMLLPKMPLASLKAFVDPDTAVLVYARTPCEDELDALMAERDDLWRELADH